MSGMKNPRMDTIPYMDTIRLLQPLNNTPELDVVEYHVICEFLKSPSIDTLLQLTKELDQTIKSHNKLSPEQASCLRYLFRDWGFHHLSEPPTKKKTQELFMIDNKVHAPGHFLAAIDFAKRNTKDHQHLMRFGLSLLLHSSLPESETIPKIAAIEQLLSHTSTLDTLPKAHKIANRIWLLVMYNITMLSYCLWGAAHLQYPLL